MKISSHDSLPPACRSFEIAPQLDQIGLALAWIRDIAKEAQWPERTVFGLTLSLDEALTNIVTYAFASGDVPASAIRLSCFLDAEDIVLRIDDEGVAFDPTLSNVRERAESLEEAEIGGHGLRLMRHYLKSIRYVRSEGRNVLTLVAR